MVFQQEMSSCIPSRLFDELSYQAETERLIPVSVLPTKLLFRHRKRERKGKRRLLTKTNIMPILNHIYLKKVDFFLT
jgi:hypothetical protein